MLGPAGGTAFFFGAGVDGGAELGGGGGDCADVGAIAADIASSITAALRDGLAMICSLFKLTCPPKLSPLTGNKTAIVGRETSPAVNRAACDVGGPRCWRLLILIGLVRRDELRRTSP